jgi:transposase
MRKLTMLRQHRETGDLSPCPHSGGRTARISDKHLKLTLTGTVDTLAFEAYLARVLAPRLRQEDVVVFDNLNVHKVSQVEQVAAERGARVIWLPPYSPDFSPIEQCWSKIKTCLRAAKARTREELEQALASAIELIMKSDIRGWFKHCGYRVASAWTPTRSVVFTDWLSMMQAEGCASRPANTRRRSRRTEWMCFHSPA